MKIVTEGISRLVFVFSDFVIKVPWINLRLQISTFLRHKRAGTLADKIREKKSDPSRPLSLLRLPFHVLGSNRREYLFYQKHRKEILLMPTKGFFFGHILVQPRGQVLSKRMRRWKRIYRRVKSLGVNQGDLINPRNFSLIMGRVVLHDFGNIHSQDVLDRLGFSSVCSCLD